MASPLHASLIALDGRGVLFIGASGSGKSTAVLRMIEEVGAQLVADDRVCLSLRERELWGAPPKTLAGQLEVYGLGVVTRPYRPECRIALVVRLGKQTKTERVAHPRYWHNNFIKADFTGADFVGVKKIPELALCVSDAGFAIRLKTCLTILDRDGFSPAGEYRING